VMLSGVCRRLSSSITLALCIVTHQGTARDGGPVVLRPIRATHCYSITELLITSKVTTGTTINTNEQSHK